MSPAATTAPGEPGKVNLVRIAHAYYTHAGFEREHQFLTDFGFTEVSRLNVGKPNETVYYRGYGSEPFVYCSTKGQEDAFGGVAFVVESRKDLELATRVVPTASEIWEMKHAPGGGECVTVKDPVDGFMIHLVYGQVRREMEEPHEQRDFNFVGAFLALYMGIYRNGERGVTDHDVARQPTEKHRPGNKFQRMKKGPAEVHKLGHFGCCVTDFARSLDFWTTHFNFKPSDLLHGPDGADMTSFMHLDRGREFVDHHSFFIYAGPKHHVHHSSYEVFDFDTQVLGHDWLVKKGYENCWGVGRHVLGSQIFDYWFDTSKFILEHYSDGDQVNCETPITRDAASPDGLYVWGPDLPPTFMD